MVPPGAVAPPAGAGLALGQVALVASRPATVVSAPLAAFLACPGVVVSHPLVAAPATAPGRHQSITARARCSVHRSAALHRSTAHRVGLAQASPTRPTSPACLFHAPPTPSAQPELTAAAFPLSLNPSRSRRVDVPTTNAPPTRIAERGHPVSAAARPRSTAPIFVTPEAIAQWTRTAARVAIVLPRGTSAPDPQIPMTRQRAPAIPIPTTATPPLTSA
jgi:hypothetical protein